MFDNSQNRNPTSRSTRQSSWARPAGRSEPGFTLAEMLIVLTILATLTVIAVQSLAPVASQARVDATRRTMEAVRDAIVSTTATSVSGFVVDVGRPPNDLGELVGWDIANNTIAAVHPAGYQGPYLLPPLNSVTQTDPLPRDGWGQLLSYTVDTQTGDVAINSPGDPSQHGAAALALLIPGNQFRATSASLTFVKPDGSTIAGTATLAHAQAAANALTSPPTGNLTGNMITFSSTPAAPLRLGPNTLTTSYAMSAANGTPVTTTSLVMRPGTNVWTIPIAP